MKIEKHGSSVRCKARRNCTYAKIGLQSSANIKCSTCIYCTHVLQFRSLKSVFRSADVRETERVTLSAVPSRRSGCSTCIWELRTQKLKSPSVENTEFKSSPFKAWRRSVCSMRCMLRLLPGISSLLISTLPLQSPAFFSPQNLSRVFPVSAVASSGSFIGPQTKIGHPAGCWFPC